MTFYVVFNNDNIEAICIFEEDANKIKDLIELSKNSYAYIKVFEGGLTRYSTYEEKVKKEFEENLKKIKLKYI
jgi:hypothetical protein